MHLLRRAGTAGGEEDGNGGDPHILAAQELAGEVPEALLEGGRHALRRQGAEEPCDKVGNPHHHHGEGNIHGDILQGNVLPAPEGGRLGFGLLAGGGAPLHLVDMGMWEPGAEEAHPREGDEHEEIQGHEQVVRHGGGGGHRGALEAVLHRHGGEVDAAADIGAGHHGGHRRQVRRLPAGGGVGAGQGEIGQQSPRHGAHRADQEDGQHLPRLPPDLLQVALEQQQGDAHGHDDAPDDVVVEHAADGDHADVGHGHGQNQGDDGPRHPGRPAVLLFQENGQGYGQAHDAQQAPGVVGADKGTAQQVFYQGH